MLIIVVIMSKVNYESDSLTQNGHKLQTDEITKVSH